MKAHLSLIFLTLFSAVVLAENSSLSTDGPGNSTHRALVVEVPSQLLSEGNIGLPPCQRCCVYANRSYTEGAVLKIEGVILQCVRDEKTLSTGGAIWRMAK